MWLFGFFVSTFASPELWRISICNLQYLGNLSEKVRTQARRRARLLGKNEGTGDFREFDRPSWSYNAQLRHLGCSEIHRIDSLNRRKFSICKAENQALTKTIWIFTSPGLDSGSLTYCWPPRVGKSGSLKLICMSCEKICFKTSVLKEANHK